MKRRLKEMIRKDIFRYYSMNSVQFIEKLFPYNVELKYIIAYRKALFYSTEKGIQK